MGEVKVKVEVEEVLLFLNFNMGFFVLMIQEVQ